MAPIIVHSIPGSPFGRAVLATLVEKNADFRFAAVSPAALKSAPHTDIHPFGRVPAIKHGDFTLYETQAILRYIDRIHPAPPLSPPGLHSLARMDQLMNIADWYLFQGCNSVIGLQRIVGPQLLGLKPDLEAIEAAMPRGHAVFAELSRLLGDAPWFTGDAVSLADLTIMPHLDFLAQTPEWDRLSEGRDNLGAWLERMRARPSYAATSWERVAAMAEKVAA